MHLFLGKKPNPFELIPFKGTFQFFSTDFSTFFVD